MMPAFVTNIKLQLRRTFHLCAAIGFLLCSSCNTNQEINHKYLQVKCNEANEGEINTWGHIKSVNFDSTIRFLSTYANLSPTPQDLFYYDSFIHIFEHPLSYFNDAKKIMAETVKSSLEKEITIYSMQGLTLPKYLEWNQYIYQLYKANKIKFEELEISISGRGISAFHILERSYKDIRVREFYTTLINDNSIPMRYKEVYKKILTGKIWNGILKTLPDGYPCIYLKGESLAKAK